jgi:segregation and condensation protein B
MLDLKNIIESLLFVADEPLAVDKLRGILETADGKEIRAALQALSDEYAARAGGFWLQEVAGGWQIRSRPEYHEWIKRLLQPSPQRLSRAALETLAVIAYKQPIIRADIEHIRGVDCGGVLRQLMERKLIRVLGRREIAGRPLIYATTKLFLEMFDLKDLNDLPTPKEIAELGNAMAGTGPAIETENDAEAAPQPLAPSEVPTLLESFEAEAPIETIDAEAHSSEFQEIPEPPTLDNTSEIIGSEASESDPSPEEIAPSGQTIPVLPPVAEEPADDDGEEPKNS